MSCNPLSAPPSALELETQCGRRFDVGLRVQVDGRPYLTENLSDLGLFVAGLSNSCSGRVIEVTIDVPDFGRYPLECLVVHVIDRGRASREGLVAGAGLFVLSAETGYHEVVEYYLDVCEYREVGARLRARGNSLLDRRRDQPGPSGILESMTLPETSSIERDQRS